MVQCKTSEMYFEIAVATCADMDIHIARWALEVTINSECVGTPRITRY